MLQRQSTNTPSFSSSTAFLFDSTSLSALPTSSYSLLSFTIFNEAVRKDGHSFPLIAPLLNRLIFPLLSHLQWLILISRLLLRCPLLRTAHLLYQNGVGYIEISLHNTPANKDAVNIATRPAHSKLNKLILARLPLALPPYRSNPSTYISGLLHVAPIYITFESLWQSILDSPLPTTLKTSRVYDACEPGHPILDSKSIPIVPLNRHSPPLVHSPEACTRTRELLTHLKLPGLLRAGRLRADIRILTGTPEHRIDEQLEEVSQNGRLAAFIAHTKQAVETNPHVLIAYAWVLYMALFSGGRHLRAALEAAGGSGSGFWTRAASPVRPYTITRGQKSRRETRSEFSTHPMIEKSLPSGSRSGSRSDSFHSKPVPGMQFFIGDEDGEDIKLEFKKRVTEAENLLSEREKEDIITEAQHIFKFMLELVGELDKVMGTTEDDIETARMHSQSNIFMAKRDSVALTQERLCKKVRTDSDKLPNESFPTYYDRYVGGPVSQAFESVMRPLEKVLSREKSASVSFKPALKEEQKYKGCKGSYQYQAGLGTILPAFVVLVAFSAWFLMGHRWSWYT
jgi:heme oxygenase